MNEKSRNNLYIYRTIFSSFFALFILVYRKTEQSCCRNVKLLQHNNTTFQQYIDSMYYVLCRNNTRLVICSSHLTFSGSKVTELYKINRFCKTDVFVFFCVCLLGIFLSHFIAVCRASLVFILRDTFFDMRVAFRTKTI